MGSGARAPSPGYRNFGGSPRCLEISGAMQPPAGIRLLTADGRASHRFYGLSEREGGRRQGRRVRPGALKRREGTAGRKRLRAKRGTDCAAAGRAPFLSCLRPSGGSRNHACAGGWAWAVGKSCGAQALSAGPLSGKDRCIRGIRENIAFMRFRYAGGSRREESIFRIVAGTGRLDGMPVHPASPGRREPSIRLPCNCAAHPCQSIRGIV